MAEQQNNTNQDSEKPAEAVPFQAAIEESDQNSSDSNQASVTWTASEFIAHDKSSGWYLMLLLAAIAISAVVFVITRDIISVVVVVVAAILMALYGSHKPRQLDYKLDPRGLTIASKYYAFDQFRSFAIIPEGAFNSIVFMPLKRFAPPISIYYDPEDEESILDLLKKSLPFEERRRDAVDSLMHKIRF